MHVTSPVASIEALIVSVPALGNAFAEGEEETLLVRATDADGRYGIGESVCTPAVVKAMIDQETIHFWSQGIKDLILGQDPIEAAALYDRVYHGSFYHGRRGTFIQAMSAVDIALYDLAGKQLGLPVYKLLGGARSDRVRPYATCYPGDIYDGPIDPIVDEIARQAALATDQGIRAIKVPVLFGDDVTDREIVRFTERCRAMVGDDIVLALDFGYRWRDWHDAAWTLKRIEDFDIHFAEAPLLHDDLHGHARLAAVSPIRVGGAEFAAGRWEVREWIETGGVSLVQPGVSRAGGFTELMRIAEMCELYGAQLMPHSFATGITDVANFHLQAAARTIPMVEFRSSRLGPSRLRTELVSPPEPDFVDGFAQLPTGPGLGVELNEDLVAAHTKSAGTAG
ncbi:MAG: mandelate racemase/muconate lactonizing enzyme family protein [Actinomycetota bacterium]